MVIETPRQFSSGSPVAWVTGARAGSRSRSVTENTGCVWSPPAWSVRSPLLPPERSSRRKCYSSSLTGEHWGCWRVKQTWSQSSPGPESHCSSYTVRHCGSLTVRQACSYTTERLTDEVRGERRYHLWSRLAP